MSLRAALARYGLTPNRNETRDCSQFADDAKSDYRGNRPIVEEANQRASDEPEYTIPSCEEAVSGGPQLSLVPSAQLQLE
jgi:hypothetical protein